MKNSIIVDCGKKAQFLKGLNGGQAGNNCTWDIDGNAFQWTEDIDGVPTLTDISADEICGADSALVKNNVVGVVAFANDVTTGDFTLGDCPQATAIIGDPRWISQNVGITDVRVNNNDGLWYNLQGVQVPHPIKGIYIQNGKKVVIK